MKKNDGGQAFPSEQGECQDGTWNQTYDPGMSLRDYFAAKAFERLVQAHIDHSVDDLSRPVIAHEAYLYADAMIEARTK